MRRINTPTGTERTARWDEAPRPGYKPKPGSKSPRVGLKKGLPGQEWMEAEAREKLCERYQAKREKPLATDIREFLAENPNYKYLGSDWCVRAVKKSVSEGLIPEENLGRGRQGGARRRLTEADKARLKTTILREAVNPKNKFKLHAVANAVGISRTVFREGWARDIAEPEGWDSLLDRAMYSHLWANRDEHKMDPKAMSGITGRNRGHMEDARDTLIAAQDLSRGAKERGKNLPVSSIFKRWGDLRNTVLSLRGATSEGEKQRLVMALIDKKII